MKACIYVYINMNNLLLFDILPLRYRKFIYTYIYNMELQDFSNDFWKLNEKKHR